MWKDDIAAVRARLAGMGHGSQTSTRFQDDVLDFIHANHAQGGSIVEIGCFHGGFTAQMAVLAREHGLTFDVIDIDHGYLAMAAKAVKANGLADHVRFNAMDFATFVRNSKDYPRPVLVFVDGDHRYKGVVADIRAIRSMNPLPYACAFHDYSLRYADGPLTIVRVDRAIHDELGATVPHRKIGEIAGSGGILQTVPGADRHYHETGQSEGVLIVLEEAGVKAA